MNVEVIIGIGKAIRKHVALIMTIPLVGIIVTGLVSFYLVIPTYESSTTLLVQPQNMTNQNMYNSILVNQQLIKTYGGLIKSKKVAMDVIRKLELAKTPEELLSHLDVKTSNVSFLITVSYTDTDPEASVRIVNEISRSFAHNVDFFVNMDNVVIVDEAEVQKDVAPVTPKPYVNMAIALCIGLLVSMAIAFLFESLSMMKRRARRKGLDVEAVQKISQ